MGKMCVPDAAVLPSPWWRRPMLSALKYGEIARTALRSLWAYPLEQILQNFFLVVILFILAQLWKATFRATGQVSISGYDYPHMLWYFVATEAIILSLPRIHQTLEQEVREGDIAVRLNLPVSYLGFHYANYAGEGISRLFFVLGIGSATAFALVGPIPFHWEGIPWMIAAYLLAQLLHFFYNSMIGLIAFWTEDVTGFFFLCDRMKWVLGGFVLPLEIFPEKIGRVLAHLPFVAMIYGPAKLFLHFSPDAARALIRSQLGWALVLWALCFGMYTLGVKRVDAQGG